MSMMQDFKAFAIKGNVIDLAVGVIIGAAFGKIVDSVVNDLIMPIVGSIFGGLDFSNYYLPLNHQPEGMPLAQAQKAGAVLAYGHFLTVLLNFLILAFIIFQMVRLIHRARTFAMKEIDKFDHTPDTPPPPTPVSEDIVLLREIRDALRQPGLPEGVRAGPPDAAR
ncbi:MAG: large conductance mechanosensitive channel protein MscL [Burkholderiaceae bacterium]